jgi:hypothetical protein
MPPNLAFQRLNVVSLTPSRRPTSTAVAPPRPRSKSQ